MTKATEPKDRSIVGPVGDARGETSPRSTVPWAWTIVALLGSGVVLNAVGQAVTQPLAGMRGGPRRPPASHDRR